MSVPKKPGWYWHKRGQHDIWAPLQVFKGTNGWPLWCNINTCCIEVADVKGVWGRKIPEMPSKPRRRVEEVDVMSIKLAEHLDAHHIQIKQPRTKGKP